MITFLSLLVPILALIFLSRWIGDIEKRRTERDVRASAERNTIFEQLTQGQPE